MQKSALRQQMRALRAALTTAERQSASARVEGHLRNLFSQQKWPAVAVYLATENEVNLDSFTTWLLAQEMPLFAPCVDNFAPLESLQAVMVGRFGVREPQPTIMPTSLPDKLVFLVPGLAFDNQGGRLGFGGGWYDRALAPFPHALKIGIAFDCQIVEAVPREAHDVLMDVLVTPSACYECKMQN